MNQKSISTGCVVEIQRDFGAGGIGYIRDDRGVSYFFHRRHVKTPGFDELDVGCEVEFKPIKAKWAMGAGPQAREVRRLK